MQNDAAAQGAVGRRSALMASDALASFMGTATRPRDQTVAEEIANSLSHGIGFLIAIAALPVLVHAAAQRGRTADVVAASLFAGTMILLYGVSTLYHVLPRGRGKVLLNRLDHASIFLFIAGSYMPFLLGVLHGAWGWSLFGVVWAAAALGVVSKLLDQLKLR